MTKEEILTGAAQAFDELTAACASIDTHTFFSHPGDKWSVAENLQHLVISTRTTTLAYSLPVWLVRMVGGKPNRPSRTFDEVLTKYNRKLAEGGKASSRYVPKPLEEKYSKEKLMGKWAAATAGFLSALKKGRSEIDLDNYLAAHPLLGRLTLRELCYFTIFHTRHHLETINKITSNPS